MYLHAAKLNPLTVALKYAFLADLSDYTSTFDADVLELDSGLAGAGGPLQLSRHMWGAHVAKHRATAYSSLTRTRGAVKVPFSSVVAATADRSGSI